MPREMARSRIFFWVSSVRPAMSPMMAVLSTIALSKPAKAPTDEPTPPARAAAAASPAFCMAAPHESAWAMAPCIIAV